MNKLNVFLLVFCFHISLWSVAQEDTDDGMIDTEKERVAPTSVVDSLYLEDQFYLGFTYDYLAGKASNVVQHNLSRGLHQREKAKKGASKREFSYLIVSLFAFRQEEAK